MSEGTSTLGASTSSPTGPPSPRPNLSSPVSSSLLLAPPSVSFTAPTPQRSPISPTRSHHQKAATEPTTSILRVPSTPPVIRQSSSSSSTGKRKADEAGVEGGGTPPKEVQRATFAVGPRPHRASATSNSTAPSSYHRKRARLSSTTYELRSSTTPDETPESRPQNARTTGSWSSRASRTSSSRPHSYRLQPPATQLPQRTPSRRSFSQASIPVSALISPHAPSISASSSFHMRDPRKPHPIQHTPWTLTLPAGEREPNEGWKGWVERGGSPLHAWLFFLGFLIFPVWWVASFTRIPRTRRLAGNDQERGVLLDDPQVEYDANSWRKRCRIMASVSFFTYIPFIVLLAIFAS